MHIAAIAHSTALSPFTPAPPPPATPPPVDRVSLGTRVLKGALAGAAYGALVGSGTAMTYVATGLNVGTAVHMGIIVAGGAAGTPVLGRILQPRLGSPDCYVVGALAATGLTWATSAFGILQNPLLGAAMGAAIGGFLGGVGAAIV